MRDNDYLMDEPFDEDEEWPEWYDGKHINEAMFCQYFLQLHPMKCIHGRLFTVDGMVEDEGEISQMILDDLLVPEDIPTLQEYLGYCLIPSTKGQKMLMLIGKGGEGKSRVGLVMRSILGDSMNTTSIQKIENNRFSRADLESKLLMVDDDMDMSALPKTNYIKSIVTAECKMDLERKEEDVGQ